MNDEETKVEGTEETTVADEATGTAPSEEAADAETTADEAVDGPETE